MRAIVQRVLEASVTIDHTCVAQIGQGVLILLGVNDMDTEREADMLAEKVSALRIFEDSAQKMNLSLADVNGAALVVPNFTLYADCRKGRRPSFVKAGRPEHSAPLYEYFVEKLKTRGVPVQTGVFGATMKVALINDGPVTMILDTDELKR